MSDKKIQVRYAPGFAESFAKNVPEEDRDEVLKEMERVMERLASNPYAGTPIVSGPFWWWFVFDNWLHRVWVDITSKIKK